MKRKVAKGCYWWNRFHFGERMSIPPGRAIWWINQKKKKNWNILIIIWLFHWLISSFFYVFKSICSSSSYIWRSLLFQTHFIKHKYNSIALFSFLLILYKSLVHALFDFEHEIKSKKKDDDVPFRSIDCNRSIDA